MTAMGFNRKLVRAIYDQVDWDEYDREVIAESVLDEERLTTAIFEANAIGFVSREQVLPVARRIATEYARLGEPTAKKQECSCQGFPGVGYPHRDFCTEPREQSYASERAEFRRAHP